MGAKKLKNNYIAQKLYAKKEFECNDITEEEFYKYMEVLHTNENGYVSLLKVNKGKAERWSLDVNTMAQLDLFQTEKDFYCSVNTLYAPGRHSGKYVAKLNALIVDLDYYNVPELAGLTPTQVVGLLENEKDYPEPSFYIDSGRGLYVIWLLENTYATTASKKYWKAIEKTLISVFSDYGADEKVHDIARVLRLVGSTNGKTGKKVRIVESPNYYNISQFNKIERYELGDIAEYFWGARELYEHKNKEPIKRKKRKQTQKVIQLKNTYTLNYSRYKDLETLVDLRADKKEEGCREYLLFLYRLNLLYCNIEPSVALKMTLALNNKLALPLEEEEVINATGNAEGISEVYHRLRNNYKDTFDISLNQHLYNGGAYIYTNKTIIKELKITEEEQTHLLTIIGTGEKKIRKGKKNKIYYKENKENISKQSEIRYQENKDNINLKKREKYNNKLKSEGKLTRDEKTELRRAEIKSLLNQGLSQRKIAEKMGINVSAINKHIKAIKSEH